MLRRDVLRASAAYALTGLPLQRGPALARRLLGPPQSFDYALLKGAARALAAAPYHPPNGHIPEEVQNLDWDQYQSMRFRPDRALWAGEALPFQIRFFHLGLFYKSPVRIYELAGGVAQELAYDPSMFDYGKSGLHPARMPKGLGFAGFRVHFRADPERDIAAFLGASYFRAVGREMQYGLSARALAIDTASSRPEEFPSFTSFWLERPRKDASRLTVYALVDSPSAAGACRFDIATGDTLLMDVDAALYPRTNIERLGIAPLTSMFLSGENDRRVADDWRPEIHDSDGLAIATGTGERIWRPLTNPPSLAFNSYVDDSPRGFGLLQRDRNFDHYQDDGVFYERRPNLWVEPKGRWGKGAVQLAELPSADETFDNIVAFFCPEGGARAGRELLYSYRLYWGSTIPAPSSLAHVVATRTGIGGVVGQRRTHVSWRFVIDFAGGTFPTLGKDTHVESVVSASRGIVELSSARPLAAVRGYRAMFDLHPTDNVSAPINLRAYLRANGQALTETWLYQWTPPAAKAR